MRGLVVQPNSQGGNFCSQAAFSAMGCRGWWPGTAQRKSGRKGGEDGGEGKAPPLIPPSISIMYLGQGEGEAEKDGNWFEHVGSGP